MPIRARAETGRPALAEADNPFWRFSLAVYGAPGVAAECLALQRALQADVNLLLFCAWLGVSGRCVDAGEIDRLDGLVRGWRDEVIRPLRAVRDALEGEANPARQAVRARILEAELVAERVEQDILHAAADQGLGAEDATLQVGANVETYLRWLWPNGAPPTAPEALISAAAHYGKPN